MLVSMMWLLQFARNSPRPSALTAPYSYICGPLATLHLVIPRVPIFKVIPHIVEQRRPITLGSARLLQGSSGVVLTTPQAKSLGALTSFGRWSCNELGKVGVFGTVKVLLAGGTAEILGDSTGISTSTWLHRRLRPVESKLETYCPAGMTGSPAEAAWDALGSSDAGIMPSVLTLLVWRPQLAFQGTTKRHFTWVKIVELRTPPGRQLRRPVIDEARA